MTVTFDGDLSGSKVANPSLIAKESLFRLMHALVIPRLAAKTYEKYFGDKIGDTITVLRPHKANVFEGRTVDPASWSSPYDDTVTMSVKKRFHYPTKYTDREATLNIQNYFNRYFKAGIEELAYKYDEAGGEALSTELFMTEAAGGTGGALQTRDFHDSRAHLVEMGVPMNVSTYALMRPADIVDISDDIKELNIPMMVQGMLRDRLHGKLGGCMIIESVHVPHYEVPTAGPGAIRGANQRGTQLVTDGWTTGRLLKKGTIIRIDGVKELQPRGSKQETGNDATFVLTEDVTTNSNANNPTNLPIYPALNDGQLTGTDGSGGSTVLSAYKNVNTVPADNAIITIVGSTGTGGGRNQGRKLRQATLFERDAMQYANVVLQQFESSPVVGRAVDEKTGLTVTFNAQYDIATGIERARADILFGVKAIYPELGLRLLTEAVN